METNPKNLIEVYTSLRVIQSMIKSQGLEAALEYVQAYLNKISAANPRLKICVDMAIDKIDLAALYRTATKDSERRDH